MKKYTLLYLMTGLLFCGCNQTGNSSNEDSPKDANKDKKANTEKIIHKNMPVGADFTNLISVSGADIVYTPGDYCIEVIGDSSLLQYMETEIESHVLTISFASERNKDLTVYDGKLNVTINISAPELQCVSLCSSGDFTTKGIWKGDDIQMGVMGEGQFHCDSIECKSLDYQASGNGDADFAHIKAEKVHFANMAGSNVKADIDADYFECENSGHSTMTFTGKANHTETTPTKNGKILLK